MRIDWLAKDRMSPLFYYFDLSFNFAVEHGALKWFCWCLALLHLISNDWWTVIWLWARRNDLCNSTAYSVSLKCIQHFTACNWVAFKWHSIQLCPVILFAVFYCCQQQQQFQWMHCFISFRTIKIFLTSIANATTAAAAVIKMIHFGDWMGKWGRQRKYSE